MTYFATFQEAEEEEERSESCEMEHSYDDTVNNILIVSQDETSLEATLAGNQAAGDSSSVISASASLAQPALGASPPLFNIVPLLPNSYLESVSCSSSASSVTDRHRISGDSWPQHARPRDTSSYLRSRLERCNAIRRSTPTTDRSNLLQQLEGLRQLDSPYAVSSTLSYHGSDSNQRSTAESRSSDLVFRFDNLLRELTFTTRSSTQSGVPSIAEALHQGTRSQDDHPRSATPVYDKSLGCVSHHFTPAVSGVSSDSVINAARNMGTTHWDTGFPHAMDIESAVREHESFNRFVARGNPLAGGDQSENRLGLTPNSSGDSIGQVFANGYVASDDEHENEGDSDHEGHSDSENFYDDNFEDYDEHYIISGEGNVVADDFAGNEEVEQEIVELGSGEEFDNRFASVDSENSRFIDNSSVADNRFASDEESAAGGESLGRNVYLETTDNSNRVRHVDNRDSHET